MGEMSFGDIGTEVPTISNDEDINVEVSIENVYVDNLYYQGSVEQLEILVYEDSGNDKRVSENVDNDHNVICYSDDSEFDYDSGKGSDTDSDHGSDKEVEFANDKLTDESGTIITRCCGTQNDWIEHKNNVAGT